MNENDLKWNMIDTSPLLHTPVFDVLRQREVSASGMQGDYIAIDAPDWAMVIPERDGDFLLVRQWRHAAQQLSLEFPGGVVDAGEDPAAAAARELREETGCNAEELICLGSVSPNPALFRNRFHVFLAKGLSPAGELHLDEDELLTCEKMPIGEVITAYGQGEFSHALMGTAIALYLTKKE